MTVSAYDSLVTSGAIGRLKRDIAVEASDDIYYVAHIRGWFERASHASSNAATESTVRVVRELVAKGFCNLATWGQKRGRLKWPSCPKAN